MAEFNGIRWAYDRYELIADGIVHGVGLVLALIGATVLIFYATLWSSYGALAAAWIYGVGLVLTLAISFSYNAWPVSRTKWYLRRFDHSAIFLLIAATYTPFLERGADDPLLLFMLVAIWLFAAAGIILKCVFPDRYDRVAILLYLAMVEPFLVRLKHSAGAGFRQGRGDWRRAYPLVRPSRSPLILAERCPAHRPHRFAVAKR
jgi:hemolysin III